MMLEKVLAVFTSVGQWISTTIPSFMALFWNTETSELTILGILSVSSLGFSVVFLLIGIIQRFLHFAG